MNEYLLLKLLHIIAFVYWLGGDLGTFIASRQVVNPALQPQSRHTALNIMLACDMGPKLAMPLIFPLGLHLAQLGGAIPVTDSLLLTAYGLGAYWFAVVLILYRNEGKPFTARLARADLYFRVVVAAVLLAWSAYGLATGAGAAWAFSKVFIFALMICCGIAIRIQLKPFVPAFADMMATGASTASDNIMQASIARCRPWVWGIWLGLFVNAALGVHLIG